MKKLYIFYLLLLSITSFSQNLVPNGSFEEMISCPNHLGQIDMAIGWSAFRESPDYFNSCSPEIPFPGVSVSVPSNYWSYQLPKTGNAYAGFATFLKTAKNEREFLGIKLTQSLIIGKKYFVSIFVNRAVTTTHQYQNIATNKIGVRLLDSAYSMSNLQPIDNNAQVFSDSIITDSLNWTKIAGSFIADSSYNYLSIGNFFNDSLTSIIAFDSSSEAYYYVDDIRLSTDSVFVNSNQDYNSVDIIEIYPNPARDWIEVRGNDIQSISLYDILGRIICFDYEYVSPSRINTSIFASGLYILTVQTNNQTVNKKVIIQ